jgi:hypothetical protein
MQSSKVEAAQRQLDWPIDLGLEGSDSGGRKSEGCRSEIEPISDPCPKIFESSFRNVVAR